MIRNLFFMILGVFCGLWIVWPQIFTSKGWECTKDIVTSSSQALTDIESIVESLPNRIKLGLAVSPQTLIRRENLTRIEKLRIIGDACFRE